MANTPTRPIRVELEIWDEFGESCKALGLDTRSDELRRHMLEVIDRYRKAVKKSA
jgi:hypothetical protein